MEVDKVADKKKKRKRVANMELDMVADIATDKKMANMELDMVADMEVKKKAFNRMTIRSGNYYK